MMFLICQMSLMSPEALACSMMLPMAYNMEHVERNVGKIFEPAEHLSVAQGEALENTTTELAIVLRDVLLCLFAILPDGLCHAWRIGKASIVGVDDALEGWLPHGIFYELSVS